ncbi:hypothetical protein V498_07106, partial [Pseudogymnoascus sp. VKM F-4517 (FW-2822)]
MISVALMVAATTKETDNSTIERSALSRDSVLLVTVRGFCRELFPANCHAEAGGREMDSHAARIAPKIPVSDADQQQAFSQEDRYNFMTEDRPALENDQLFGELINSTEDRDLLARCLFTWRELFVTDVRERESYYQDYERDDIENTITSLIHTSTQIESKKAKGRDTRRDERERPQPSGAKHPLELDDDSRCLIRKALVLADSRDGTTEDLQASGSGEWRRLDALDGRVAGMNGENAAVTWGGGDENVAAIARAIPRGMISETHEHDTPSTSRGFVDLAEITSLKTAMC